MYLPVARGRACAPLVAMRDEDAAYALIAQQVSTATDRRDVGALVVLERKLRALPVPSVATMQLTGIGKTIASRKLREITDKAIGARFDVIMTVWKEAFRTGKLRRGRGKYQSTPVLQIWTAYLRSIDAVPSCLSSCKRVAGVLAEHGFQLWRDIPGANPVSLRQDPRLLQGDRALLTRAIDHAEAHFVEDLHSRRILPSYFGSTSRGSADATADILTAHADKSQSNLLEGTLAHWGIGSVGASTLRAGINVLTKALQHGAPLTGMLEAFVQKTLLDSAPKSLASIASALRCWHRFAAQIINIDDCETLPPRHDSHVMMFIAVFRNGGTCRNYVSAIRFGCRMLDLSMA